MLSGATTKPKVLVSAVSGLSARLPPPRVTQVSAGQGWMLPYSEDDTPLRAQSVSPAIGSGPEHGSWPDTLPSAWAANSSEMLGARTARLKLPRNLSAWIGAYCSSALYVSALKPLPPAT